MKATIDHRLRRLELNLHTARDQDVPGGSFSAVRLQACLLASHFGDYREGEPPVAPYARALGYRSPGEFRQEVQRHPAEWTQRHNAAFERLLQGHGLDRRTGCELEAWGGLFDKVPQALRDQLGFQYAADAFL
jgi:hypothetical protein